MNRALAAALAAAVASACVILERDPLDTEPPPPPPDASTGSGGPDGSIGFGDGGEITPIGRPIPGSGVDGDNGTAVLALVRIDQGTANLADALQDLLALIPDRLAPEGLKVTSVAVGDLYRTRLLWASRADGSTPPSLAGVLRAAASSSAELAPLNCTTAALQAFGPTLLTLGANGVRPFIPVPGALLVVLIDSGARPSPLTSCTTAGFWAADPVQWFAYGPPVPRARTHFAFLATPENADLSGLRSRCLGIAGFPPTALDVIAPSPNPYFDPLSAQMNGIAPALVHRADLCDALGSGGGSFWSDVGQRWLPQLAASR